jgi:hypothetical protein
VILTNFLNRFGNVRFLSRSGFSYGRPFKINFMLSSSLKRGIGKGVSFVVCGHKELERE